MTKNGIINPVFLQWESLSCFLVCVGRFRAHSRSFCSDIFSFSCLLASMTAARRQEHYRRRSRTHYALAKSNELLSPEYLILHVFSSTWAEQLLHLHPDSSDNACRTCSRQKSGAWRKAKSFLILCDWGLLQAMATDSLCEGDNDAYTHSCQSAGRGGIVFEENKNRL